MPLTFSEPIRAFYEKYDEANRLATGVFQLEFARTQEILQRYLPAPPATILDIGGGPGIYSCWRNWDTKYICWIPYLHTSITRNRYLPDNPNTQLPASFLAMHAGLILPIKAPTPS